MGIDYWIPEVGTELNERRLREQLTALGYQVSRYVYPAGTWFPEHTHPFDKIEVVLGGRFQMTMCGTSVVLEPGQAIHVPEGSLHSAEVVGSLPVISLDAVKAGI